MATHKKRHKGKSLPNSDIIVELFIIRVLKVRKVSTSCELFSLSRRAALFSCVKRWFAWLRNTKLPKAEALKAARTRKGSQGPKWAKGPKGQSLGEPGIAKSSPQSLFQIRRWKVSILVRKILRWRIEMFWF
jgi:hypothetical protein